VTAWYQGCSAREGTPSKRPTTVRYVGRFLEDPLDVPWPVVEYVASQLGIADASCVKRYTDRPMTAYEHAWQIRDAYGLRLLEDAEVTAGVRQFLDGRAWTHAEEPGAGWPVAAAAGTGATVPRRHSLGGKPELGRDRATGRPSQLLAVARTSDGLANTAPPATRGGGRPAGV